MTEKIFSVDKQGDEEKKLQEKTKRVEAELAVLAQVVGSDFEMNVTFGEIGKGSFFNPEDSSITLDPKIIKENKEWLAEFVAGHEGGHRAITRSLEQIGVKPEKSLELYEKLGFGYLCNCIEDCADNDWVGGLFEKFKESSDRNYQEQFDSENAVLTTPEIDQMIGLLGYTPKFAQYGSEIIRKWATGGYSKKLEPEVEQSIKATEEHFQQAWQNIPGKYSKELERVESARERFQIIYEKVLPIFEELVNSDIDQEKMRQLANDILQNQKEQQKGGQGKSDPSHGDGTGQSPSLPEALRKELEKAQNENMKQTLEKLEKQIDDLNKQLANPDLSEEQKEALKNKLDDLSGLKEGLENGDKNSVPWDKLSDDLKEKLKELYNKLPKTTRDGLQDKAKKTLESIDDKLIKETRGKLQEDGTPLTHEEVKQAKEEIKERKKETSPLARSGEKKKEQEKARADKQIQDQMEARLKGEMNEYDKIYREIAPIIDELYQRIHKLFIPQRHPRWQKGHPTGHRLDLARVMQFQADKTQHDKLWERKTIPKTIDYRFILLVDLSSSMQGETIEQTFRAVIVLSEVLNRLGVKFEIIGFQDVNILYKDFNTPMSPEIRRKMLIMLNEVSDSGEHNKASYNSDGYCLDEASKRLQKNKGKDNFLLVFSDGIPVPDSSHSGAKYDLNKIIEKIRKTTKQKLVGAGLGPDTEHVSDYYPTSLPSLSLKQLVPLLGDLLEDMIKFPSKYK